MIPQELDVGIAFQSYFKPGARQYHPVTNYEIKSPLVRMSGTNPATSPDIFHIYLDLKQLYT